MKTISFLTTIDYACFQDTEVLQQRDNATDGWFLIRQSTKEKNVFVITLCFKGRLFHNQVREIGALIMYELLIAADCIQGRQVQHWQGPRQPSVRVAVRAGRAPHVCGPRLPSQADAAR